MAPALGGNMANTMFGWIYDAHTVGALVYGVILRAQSDSTQESRAHSDPRLECKTLYFYDGGSRN